MASIVGEVELAALEGFYKRIYADEVERAVPIDTVLQEIIRFREDESDGENFNQPVSLKLAQGISFARTDSGAFALNLVKATQTKNAQITGSQHLLRHSLAYEAAAKAAKSERAFKRATVQHMLDMKESIHKFVEIDLWSGQSGLGIVEAVNSLVITITKASWAPAFWSGMDGMTIQIYDTTLATLRAAATSITSVDLDARTITVNSTTSVVAGDVIFFGVQGTSQQWDGTNHNAMVGLQKIGSTTSGTLFNISATTFSLWRANVLSAANGILSFALIQKGVAAAMSRGGTGDCICLVNPMSWADLMTDQASMRRYGAERKSMENGAEAIRFWSQAGSIDIRSSIYCKRGVAFVIAPKKFKRLGATDVTFDLGKMGLPGGQIFRHMENNAGIEFRCYSHQCLYTSKLGSVVTIGSTAGATSITDSGP